MACGLCCSCYFLFPGVPSSPLAAVIVLLFSSDSAAVGVTLLSSPVQHAVNFLLASLLPLQLHLLEEVCPSALVISVLDCGFENSAESLSLWRFIGAYFRVQHITVSGQRVRSFLHFFTLFVRVNSL